MKTLVLDCSFYPMATIICDEQIVASKISENQRSCDNYMGLIDECLTSAKLHIDDINEIAVNLGPGSFTGLRVSVSIAKAFGFGNDIKFKAFTSFDYLDEKDFVLVDAFSNFVYIQEPGKKADCVDVKDLSKSINYKTTSKNLEDKLLNLGYNIELRQPKDIVDVLKAAKEVTAKELMPLYLRKSQAEIQRESRGLKI